MRFVIWAMTMGAPTGLSHSNHRVLIQFKSGVLLRTPFFLGSGITRKLTHAS